MNLLAVFWTVIVYIALISFAIMSALIIYKAYFELKKMLKGMDTSKEHREAPKNNE